MLVVFIVLKLSTYFYYKNAKHSIYKYVFTFHGLKQYLDRIYISWFDRIFGYDCDTILISLKVMQFLCNN